MGNKYLDDEQQALEDGATEIVKIFTRVKELAEAVDGANVGSDVKYAISKRLKKIVGDVWSDVPNQYKPVVQDLVQHAMFPNEAEPSPLLQDPPPETPNVE